MLPAVYDAKSKPDFVNSEPLSLERVPITPLNNLYKELIAVLRNLSVF